MLAESEIIIFHFLWRYMSQTHTIYHTLVNGGDDMNNRKSGAIAMPSVTYAMKAQKLLTSKGYTCDIQRISGSLTKSCTYTIYVNEDADIVKKILLDNHILIDGMES
jgi:hypothetical protein